MDPATGGKSKATDDALDYQIEIAATIVELVNLAGEKPHQVNEGLALLDRWHTEQLMSSDTKVDPMMKIIEEGGPFYTRGNLPEYAEYFKRIGRPEISERMLKKYVENPAYKP